MVHWGKKLYDFFSDTKYSFVLSCLNLSCKRNTVLYGASNCNYICAYQ